MYRNKSKSTTETLSNILIQNNKVMTDVRFY